MKKRVLITGSNGLLGQKLAQLLVHNADIELIATSRFQRAPVRCLHDPGTTAGHGGEAQPGNSATDLPGDLAIRMVLREPGRAEDRHARAHEMQAPKPANELGSDPDDSEQLRGPGPGRRQKPLLVAIGGDRSPPFGRVE